MKKTTTLFLFVMILTLNACVPSPVTLPTAEPDTSTEAQIPTAILPTEADQSATWNLDAREILFIPDQYLGDYVSASTGRKMILWPGFCPTHVRIRPERIKELRQEYPQARVVVHPECRPEVVALADEVASTSGMCRYARRADVKEMVVGSRRWA